MKNFYIEKWEEDNNFHIHFTDELYAKLRPFYDNSGRNSYFSLYFRMFGLLPYNFFQYVQVTFHARIKLDKVLHFSAFSFPAKNDAEAFVTELEKRITWIKEFKND